MPEARGEAARIVQEAEAYRERDVAEANGQASRFKQVYEEYRKAPDMTRERMYLETMEKVLGASDKIILEPERLERAGRRALPAAQRAATPPPAQGAQK